MDDDTMSRDDMLAWASFKLNRLQQGIRVLELYDEEGQLTQGRLLVRINKSMG